MLYSFPCLKDYIDNDTLIETIEKVFSYIKTTSTKIWADFDSTLLTDLAYEYYYRSYKKPLKVLYYHKFEALDLTTVSDVEAFFTLVGKIVYARFGENWERIWEAYFLTDYKPLENYDMYQKRTPDLTYDTDIDRNAKVVIDNDTTSSVVPFNESEATLVSSATGDSTTTEEAAYNHTDNQMKETGKEELERSGNIGVTTSQQMLQAELDVRKFDFQEKVFSDLDKIIFRDYLPID